MSGMLARAAGRGRVSVVATWVALSDRLANALGINPTQTASFTVQNDGNVSTNFGVVEAWTNGTPGNYWVRATLTSGALTSGTTGAWLNLATSRAWTVAETGVNHQSEAVLTVQIASDAGGSTIVATATITIRATTNNL